MNIFITGASGFVGGAATRHLVAAGHSVRAMSRSDKSDAAIRDAAASYASTEVLDADQFLKQVTGELDVMLGVIYALLALAERHPSCPVAVIPGITAVAAAAAAASSQGLPWPLALQQDALLIRPTPDDPAQLEALLAEAAAAATVLALLKLGHRWAWVRPLLAQRNLLAGALFAQRVGWPDQLLAPAAEVPADEQPYFSLLLIRQSWPEVLP